MGKQILPSLLSANFYELGDELKRIENAGIQSLHLDVMDGHYVPNISFGPGLIKSLRSHTDLFFDCHLMVEEPSFLYESFQEAGVNLLTVQWEACKHIHRDIQTIKKLGMKAGIALNPATPVSVLENMIEDLDLVLIMSVNPGFGGQSFIPQTLQKIKEMKKMVENKNSSIIIEVDGGIKDNNLAEILEAGCDWAVAGSAIFQEGKTEENARKMIKLLER